MKVIETLFQEAVSAAQLPGAVALGLNRDGIIAGAEAGFAADTVMWVASMTKAITATVAMQQVEQGKLALDTPAREICPELGKIQVLTGFADDGSPLLRPPRSEITLRQLLTHTAGFGYDIWEPDIERFQEATDLPAVGSGLKVALQSPLLFDPGTDWRYGISIDWAGQMVEAVTGLRLGEVMRRDVFEPLGMDSTAFRITPAMRQRLARIHVRTERGALQAVDMEIPQDPEFEGGGGGLYATAADYARFLQMFLNDGRVGDTQILMPETVQEMARSQIPGQAIHPLRANLAARSNDYALFPGQPKGWGLSFLINETDSPGRRRAGSLAWAGLSNCYYWIDRQSGIAGVFMSQLLPFADKAALDLFDAFEQATYQTAES